MEENIIQNKKYRLVTANCTTTMWDRMSINIGNIHSEYYINIGLIVI